MTLHKGSYSELAEVPDQQLKAQLYQVSLISIST